VSDETARPFNGCPDDGQCTHDCANACWRVLNAGPLSGTFPGDQWPQFIHAAETARHAKAIGYVSPFKSMNHDGVHYELRRRSHDCTAESCRGMSDDQGPCGGCCSCLGQCVQELDGPADAGQISLCGCPRAAENVHEWTCRYWYVRDPATPAPIAPCGCTNVSKCRAHGAPRCAHCTPTEKCAYHRVPSGLECKACGHDLNQHRGTPKPRPSSTACRNCSACDREQAAEAHETMQRVTGQPQYPGPGEIRIRHSQQARDALDSLRVDGTWPPVKVDASAIREETERLIDSWIAGQMVERAKADQQSLLRLGAKGDGRDFLFECDTGDSMMIDRRRLRVLVRMDPPVSLELVLDGGPTPWGELAAEIGKIMSDAAGRIQEAVRHYLSREDAQ
jgi:hypothetical protein